MEGDSLIKLFIINGWTRDGSKMFRKSPEFVILRLK